MKYSILQNRTSFVGAKAIISVFTGKIWKRECDDMVTLLPVHR